MEEAKFQLIPLYDLQAVLNTWSFYIGGIERVLENSGDDTSMEKIFNDLMSGRMLLWVGFVNGAYAGFVTTQVVDTPPNKRHLWIVHCYKKPKMGSEWLIEGLKIIEEFARKHGCQNIRFYAKSKPWQDKFIDLGYIPGYIEFVKEVKK